jgi:hypothetical protein
VFLTSHCLRESATTARRYSQTNCQQKLIYPAFQYYRAKLSLQYPKSEVKARQGGIKSLDSCIFVLVMEHGLTNTNLQAQASLLARNVSKIPSI